MARNLLLMTIRIDPWNEVRPYFASLALLSETDHYPLADVYWSST